MPSIDLVYYLLALAVGWFARHRGLLAPKNSFDALSKELQTSRDRSALLAQLQELLAHLDQSSKNQEPRTK